MFGLPCDVPLKGFTEETTEKPVLDFSGFWTGDFQNKYARWLESSLLPRGVLTKNHSTIEYYCFQQGNRPIGKDGFIFEPEYLESRLNIGDANDFSIPENAGRLEAFVKDLEVLRKKLKSVNKELYIYVAPNKAFMYPDKIPANYAALYNEETVNVKDLFRELIEDTEIPCLFCEDLKDELQYPAFYPTGIHWAMSFEQYASSRIVEDLRDVTGKNYCGIALGEPVASSTPGWRDTDVYDLLNLWQEPHETFYSYKLERKVPADFDRLKVFIYGDSFALGLRKDVLECFPEDDIFYVNYINYIYDSKGNFIRLYDDWNNLDWKKCLDNSDAVMIEMTEPKIKDYTKGFVKYLIQYLDEYDPDTRSTAYMETLDAVDQDTWDMEYMNGVWQKEDGHAWMKGRALLAVQNSRITQEGMQIEFDVPDLLFSEEGDAEVTIYVNGRNMWRRTYTAPQSEKVILDKEKLRTSDQDVYEVIIESSKTFCPHEMGINEDDRELALRVKYLGGLR